MSLNKVLIIGNLGRDPEIRYLPSGKPCANFSIAAGRKYKVEGQIKEETEWFNVVAFGRLAEICGEYLKKGRPLFVEGRFRTRSWIDNTGIKHYRTEVVAEAMTLMGRPAGNGNPEPPVISETSETADSDEPGF
jgi:single-strand DNA-binding protein